MSLRDGATIHVETGAETWHLALWACGESSSVVVDIERHGHSFNPSLTAASAGALIDALLTLLPAAREHSNLAGPSKD